MKRASPFRKSCIPALAVIGMFLLVACGGSKFPASVATSTVVSSASPETADSISTEETEGETLQNLEILVGDTTFTAQMADTEAARQLAECLPLELDMQELNGNEKYSYLSQALSTNASCPDSIHTGDLMLFGSDCLVLFYKDFSTSYSYTPIGKLDNPQGLSAALGRGDVTVTFRMS